MKNVLNIRKNDQVKVLAGKDKGKSGTVLEVFPKERKIVVQGLNIHIRFSRPKRQGEKGQRMELPASMPASKVMLICPHCGKLTRVGHVSTESGHFRKCKKCGKAV